MWWGGGRQIFPSKAVDKVSTSMSSRLHTQILYMLLLLLITAISGGSINRQTLYILWEKKNLIDFEYSLNSEMWEKREKGRGVEGREDLLFIECLLFQGLSDLVTCKGSLNLLSRSWYYHFIWIRKLKFWNVKNMYIYSTYIAHQKCTIIVLISEYIKMETIKCDSFF